MLMILAMKDVLPIPELHTLNSGIEQMLACSRVFSPIALLSNSTVCYEQTNHTVQTNPGEMN
jgi:hypothetical protein